MLSSLTEMSMGNIMDHSGVIGELFQLRHDFIEKASFCEKELLNITQRMLRNNIHQSVYLRMLAHMNVEKHKLNVEYKSAVNDVVNMYAQSSKKPQDDMDAISLNQVSQTFDVDVL